VLRSFPVHALKIDQSFVRDLAIAPSAQAICRTIIGLAHTLKLEVLAEGIESPEQLAHLVELGCEYGQGFLFGAPAPAPEAGRRFLGAAG
jgi:EAL domain-containing protein (putative c-di-GMP-specific phosphodiesterase class I)